VKREQKKYPKLGTSSPLGLKVFSSAIFFPSKVLGASVSPDPFSSVLIIEGKFKNAVQMITSRGYCTVDQALRETL
jgi:hypothetical protein